MAPAEEEASASTTPAVIALSLGLAGAAGARPLPAAALRERSAARVVPVGPASPVTLRGSLT